jgi:cobalt-precorrin-5B (C1)-methyltransferase
MSALRTGYTTGSCAAAAAKAAVRLLADGRAVERLEIPLPGGARCELPLV